MNSLNMVLLEGHLTADPQVKTTEKGTPLCTFPFGKGRAGLLQTASHNREPLRTS